MMSMFNTFLTFLCIFLILILKLSGFYKNDKYTSNDHKQMVEMSRSLSLYFRMTSAGVKITNILPFILHRPAYNDKYHTIYKKQVIHQTNIVKTPSVKKQSATIHSTNGDNLAFICIYQRFLSTCFDRSLGSFVLFKYMSQDVECTDLKHNHEFETSASSFVGLVLIMLKVSKLTFGLKESTKFHQVTSRAQCLLQQQEYKMLIEYYIKLSPGKLITV